MGAEVTGVDLRDKLDLVAAAGADHVIDAADDYTRLSERYDLVYDIPGNHAHLARQARDRTRAVPT